MIRALALAVASFLAVVLLVGGSSWWLYSTIVHRSSVSFANGPPGNVYFAVESGGVCMLTYAKDLENALSSPGATLLLTSPICSWRGGDTQRLEILESTETHQIIRVNHVNTALATWEYRAERSSASLKSYRVLFGIGDTPVALAIFLLSVYIALKTSLFAFRRARDRVHETAT